VKAAKSLTKAGENARKIATILEAGEGYADLYRTIMAGPSGQRADLLVGRVRYRPDGPDEFEIIDMTSSVNRGDLAGYARRDRGAWSITAYDDHRGYRWLGYASSLSVGVDCVVNGEHAALGRHDSRRISSGSLRREAA
jgi:hypothetical protein